MNIKEYLLNKLAQEAAELSVAATKALEFGLDDVNPNTPGGENNRQRIVAELNDILGVISLLEAGEYFDGPWFDREAQHKKVLKIQKWMAYSEEKGCLKP